MKLDSKAWKEEELPFEGVREAATQLIRSVAQWKRGKTYKFELDRGNCTEDTSCEVITYGAHVGKDYWLCRKSRHVINESKYRRLVEVLNGSLPGPEEGSWQLPDVAARSLLEQEYIETLSACNVVRRVTPPHPQEVSGWVLVNLEYELGKPLNTREFNEWVCPLLPQRETHVERGVAAEGNSATDSVERSLVVSLVADEHAHNPHHTKAYYASVEELTYDYESHVLEWTMCTTSDAGGNVPKWIQNATIARTVAKDVPYLLNSKLMQQ